MKEKEVEVFLGDAECKRVDVLGGKAWKCKVPGHLLPISVDVSEGLFEELETGVEDDKIKFSTLQEVVKIGKTLPPK